MTSPSSPQSSPASSAEPDEDTAISSERAQHIENEVKVALKDARKRIEKGEDADGNDCWSWIDHMQVNEWSVSLMSLDIVQPSPKLHQNIHDYKKNLLLPVLNRTLLRLLQENLTDKPTRRAAIAVEKDDMHVSIVGDETEDKNLCKAVVALYYHALEAVLYCETARLNETSDRERRVRAVLSDICFHRALLVCCITCATKAIGVTHKLRGPASNPGGVMLLVPTVDSSLRVCECDPYDFLKVSETFCRSLAPNSPARGQLGSPLVFALPRILGQQIKQAEVQCLDSLLWTTTRDYKEDPYEESLELCDRIEQRRKLNKAVLEDDTPGSFFWWPPEVLIDQKDDNNSTGRSDNKDESASATSSSHSYPSPEHEDYPEYVYISFIFQKVLRLAETRIQALCNALHVPSIIADRTLACFTSFLRHHVDALYDRHLDVWVLCCLYGVSKTWNNSTNANEVTFARIIEAFVQLRGPELGEITCQRIVRTVPLFGANETVGGSKAEPVGDVIQLYNIIFLPRMKDYLLKMAPRKRDRDMHTSSDVNIQVTMNAPNAHARQKRERMDKQWLLGNHTQTLLRFGNVQSIKS